MARLHSSTPTSCFNCKVTDVALFSCSNCKQNYYCSKTCQRNDWKNGHKIICKNSSDQRRIVKIFENEKGDEKKAHASEECANCCIQGIKFSKCSRCKLTPYCCEACQLQHWNAVGGHKKFCVSASNQKLSDRVKLENDQSDFKCVICQENISSVDQCLLPCLHVFHSQCIINFRESGSIQACPICRSLFSKKENSEEKYERALLCFEKNMNSVGQCENPRSILTLAKRKDLDEVQRLWTDLASQGHLKAQLQLASVYLKGSIFKKNDEEEFYWFEKLAHQGIPFAQGYLGCLYRAGTGVKQSDTEAFRWYEKAAQQNEDTA